jgi:hypothetical protein
VLLTQRQQKELHLFFVQRAQDGPDLKMVSNMNSLIQLLVNLDDAKNIFGSEHDQRAGRRRARPVVFEESSGYRLEEASHRVFRHISGGKGLLRRPHGVFYVRGCGPSAGQEESETRSRTVGESL